VAEEEKFQKNDNFVCLFIFFSTQNSFIAFIFELIAVIWSLVILEVGFPSTIS
jgi:hypothetical protein